MNGSSDNTPTASSPYRRLLGVIEVVLIFLLLFVFAGSPPPGDDEPHYLGKAKQYWNPDWLAGDFFLETPDAHVVFNWTIGWLTLFFSLTTVAWIGRCAGWLLLAIAWRRLSWAILPRPLAALWTMALFLVFQEHGTAAREWIVGGVEAKCFAYVFVILGLEQLVRGRWKCMWPLFGIGAAFHVLVGGWAVVAGLLAWAATKERPSFTSMSPSLIAGGILSLPGVIPALMLSWDADPAVVAEANQIYVYQRLNHHLVVYDFPLRYKLQLAAVLTAWLAVCHATRGEPSRMPLRRFVLGSLMIGIAGIVIDQATAVLQMGELGASLLRFYWYRLADVMVPIGLAFALAEWAFAERKWPAPKFSQALLFVLILTPLLALSWRFHAERADGRPQADRQSQIGDDEPEEYSHWLRTCAWIEANTRPSDRFLIPTNIQTLRWYAQRSEVVSWKDIPQDAAGIVEWKQRVSAVTKWYETLSADELDAMGQKRLHDRLRQIASPDIYDIQYVIIAGREQGRRLALPMVFATSYDPQPSFTVYRVPPEAKSPD